MSRFVRRMSGRSLVSSNSGADDGNSSSDDSAGGTENMMELHNSSTFSDLASKKSFSSKGLDNAYGHDSAGSSEYSSSSSYSSQQSPIKPDKNLKVQKSSSTPKKDTDWSAFDESFCEPPHQPDGLTGIDTLDPLTGRPMLSNKPIIPTRATSNVRKKTPPKPIVRKPSVKQVAQPKPMPAVIEKRNTRFSSVDVSPDKSESDYSSDDSGSPSESESEPPDQGETLIGFRAMNPRTGLPLPRADSMRSKGSRESINSPIILAPVRETFKQTPTVNQRPTNAIANGKGGTPDVSNHDESSYESESDYESEEEPPEQDDGLTGINTIDPQTGKAIIISKPKPIRANERAVLPSPRGSALRQTHPAASNKPAARQSTSSAPPMQKNQSGTRRQEDSESEYSSGSGSGSEYETGSSSSGSEYETGTDYTSSTAGDGLHKSKDDESSDDEEGRAIMKHIMNNMDSINDPDEENDSRPQRRNTPIMRANSKRVSQRGLQDSISDLNIEDGRNPIRTNSSRSAGNTRISEPKNNTHGRGGEQARTNSSRSAGNTRMSGRGVIRTKSSRSVDAARRRASTKLSLLKRNMSESILDPDMMSSKNSLDRPLRKKDSVLDPDMSSNTTLFDRSSKRESILDPDMSSKTTLDRPLKKNDSILDPDMSSNTTFGRSSKQESILDPDMSSNTTFSGPSKRKLRPLVTKKQQHVSTESILDPDLMDNTTSQANVDTPPKHTPPLSRSQSVPKQVMTTVAEADTALDPTRRELLQKKNSLAKHFSRSDLHPEIAAPKPSSTVTGTGSGVATAGESDSEYSGSSYETGSSYTDESGSSEESESGSESSEEEGDASSQDKEPGSVDFGDEGSMYSNVFPQTEGALKSVVENESEEEAEPDTDEYSDNESLSPQEIFGLKEEENLGSSASDDNDGEPDTDEYSDGESIAPNEVFGLSADYTKAESSSESDEDDEPDTDEYSENESLDAHELLGIEKEETPSPPQPSPPEVRPPPQRALSEQSLDPFEVFTNKKRVAPPKRPVPVRQDSNRSSLSADVAPSSDEFSDEESISESDVFDKSYIEPGDKDDYSNEGSLSESDVFDEEDIEPESADEYGADNSMSATSIFDVEDIEPESAGEYSAENSMSATSIFDGEDIEPSTPEGSKEGSLSNASLFGPEDSATENDSLDGDISMQINIHVLEDIPGKYVPERGSLPSKRKNETKNRKEAPPEGKEGGPFDNDSLDGELSIHEHAVIVQGIPGQPVHVPLPRRPKPQNQDTARFSQQETTIMQVAKYKVPTQSNGGVDVTEQNTPDKPTPESRPSKPQRQDTARFAKQEVKDVQGTKSNATRQNKESSDVKEQTKESNGGGGVFGRWFGTKNTKNDEDGKTQNTDSSPKENAVEHDFPRNGDGTIESNDPLALKNEDVARPLLDTNSGSEHADHPDLMSSLAHIGDSNGLDSRVSDYTDRFLAPIEETSDEESSKRSLGFEESRRSLGFVFPPAILEENAAETDTVDEIVYGVSRGKDSLTFTGESGKSTKSSSSGILPSELSGETATKKGSDSLDRKELKSSASSGSSSRYRSKRKKKMKSQETKRSSSSIDQSLLKADQSSTPNGSSDKAKRANSNEQLKRRSSSKFSVLKPLPTELNTEEILRAEKRDRKALLRRSSRSSYGLRKLSSLHSLGISEFSPSTFVRPVANRAGESESSMHSKLKQDALQSLDVIEKDYALDSRRLSPSDSVLIINGWNRIQQCHIFLDALLARWRILVAFDELVATEEARNNQLLSTETKRSLYLESLNLVDENGDPISKCLGARMSDVKRLLVQMLDYEVKSLHSQTHMGGSINRAHIPFGDYRESKLMLKNEPDRLDVSLGERFRVFSRHGIRPLYWVLFCDAFLWGVQNHNPRKNTADFEDLVKPPTQSAYAYFVSSQIAKRAIEEQLYLREQLTLANVAASVKQTWDNVRSTSNEQIYFGEKFLRQLLTNCPELRRYFGKVDMDTIPIHFARTVDMFMANIDAIGSGTFAVRKACYELSSALREHDIPYLLLPVFGWHLIKAFKPFFKQEEKRTKDKENHIKAESLKRSFAFLYSEVMDVVSQSIIFQGKLVTEATSFIYCVAAELDWAADVVAKRLLDVKEEIKITGTYTHTSEEIESGARIAWRNSSRVPEDWKSFEFRDYRKMETPDRIFSAVEEYLNIAKSGTNVRSILAVFKPKSPNYAYGTRFWSSNFINYAGYQDRQGVIGDPETLEFTEFLIQNKLWSPPQKRSEFDILPLVLKMVGEQKPYIHELSKESTHEVAIEHPTFRKIRQLGLRCTGISAISNKSLNLGGLEYQCCPFNGYSISSQVAQKLLKRNGVYEKLAKAMSIAMSERLYKEKVEHELQIAILHSFEKAGYAVRDPEEVAAALSKHCENERLEGRECLSQNPKVSTDSPPNVTVGKYDSSYEYPQFESLCIHWRAMDGPYYEYTKSLLPAKKSTRKESESYSRDFQRPLVLIAFTSERRDAESVALRLGRALRVCEPIVKSLDDVKRLNMLTEHPITHFIVLCGTGDSDGFPLVAQSFASTPFAPDLLKNVKFTVLAFGSTLDPNFGQVGKELEKNLIGAGSNAFLPLTTVDGVLGFESFVSDWLGLVKRIVLPEYIQAALSVNDIADRRPSHRIKWLEYVQPTGSIEQFIWPEKSASVCKKNDELIVDGSMTGRSTRRLTFKLPQGMSYETGDHLCVHPLNPLPLIQRFAACFEDELLAAAAKTGEYPFPRSTKLGNQVRSLWQMDQPFNIERIENGISIPTQVRFETPSTLSDVLQAHVELTLLPHELVNTLLLLRRLLNLEVSSTTSATLKNEFEGKDAEAVKEFDRQSYTVIFGEGREKEAAITSFLAQYPTIVDLLEGFKTILCCRRPVLPHDDGNPRLSLGNLLAVLPPLRTRTYTISSSSKIDSSKVSITVAVLRSTAANGAKIDGVCSNYLARLRPNKDRAKIWVRPSSFRGPKGTKSPVIYIGAGAGLSGIMGFLKDRVNAMKKENGEAGECHLFFGCRSVEDRIYAKYIDTWEKQGVLKLHLAFSRATFTSPTHIPDLMNKFGPELCKLLLQDNTLYYICGDSKVASDCYEACVHVLQEHGNLSRASSIQHLNCMREEGRWRCDLWGVMYHFNSTKASLRRAALLPAESWLRKFGQISTKAHHGENKHK